MFKQIFFAFFLLWAPFLYTMESFNQQGKNDSGSSEEEFYSHQTWAEKINAFMHAYEKSADELFLGKNKNLCLVKIYLTFEDGGTIPYLIPTLFISGNHLINTKGEIPQNRRLSYAEMGLPFSPATPFRGIYCNFSSISLKEKIRFFKHFEDFFKHQFESIERIKQEFIEYLCAAENASLLHHMGKLSFQSFKTITKKDTHIQNKQTTRKPAEPDFFMQVFKRNFFTLLEERLNQPFEKMTHHHISTLQENVFREIVTTALTAENLSFAILVDELTEEKVKIIEDLFVTDLFYHSEQIAYCKVIDFFENLPFYSPLLPEDLRNKVQTTAIKKIELWFHTSRDPCFQCQETVLVLDKDLESNAQEVIVLLTGGRNYPSKKLNDFRLELNGRGKLHSPFYKVFRKYFINKMNETNDTRLLEEPEEGIKLFTREEFLRRQERLNQ